MSAVPGPPSAHDPPITEAAYKKELDVVADEIYETIYIHHAMEEINRLCSGSAGNGESVPPLR